MLIVTGLSGAWDHKTMGTSENRVQYAVESHFDRCVKCILGNKLSTSAAIISDGTIILAMLHYNDNAISQYCCCDYMKLSHRSVLRFPFMPISTQSKYLLIRCFLPPLNNMVAHISFGLCNSCSMS